MCGITAISANKEALSFLLQGLEKLEYRGYDSAGITTIEGNHLFTKKAKGRLQNLKDLLKDENVLGHVGIGHTRWATHGIPSNLNSHPHTNNDETISLVHNGIIENYRELKEILILQGYQFHSETDSEVVVHMMDYYYKKEKDLQKALERVITRIEGSYALCIVSTIEPDKVFIAKKDSPLVIGKTADASVAASDIPAILDYTKDVYFLEDYEIAILNKGNVSFFDQYGNPIEKEITTIPYDNEAAQKGGYDTFMLKEIHEQPEVTKKMMSEYIDDDSKDVIKGMPDLSKYKNVTIVACGSAMHAGLIGKHLIEEYGNIPVNVEIASEFRYKKLFIDKDTLVIAISQSGETADTLEAVKIANEKGCDTLGIVNVNGSSIARETSKVLYTKAGPEIAVATTKAYSAQVTLLSFLAYSLAKKSKDKEVLNEVSTFLSDLNRLPILMQEILNNKNEYKCLADKIYDKDNIFFIGRGIDEALCMEGSLKLKEISYIHSEAYAAGELKHGTISLIEDGTPVFGIVTDKKIADKTISNLKEVKSRGANVIYVTTNNLNKDGDFYDEKVIIPDTNPLLQPLLTILPLQLTAYYVAKNKNCDIDKPKNLAKSVTVE